MDIITRQYAPYLQYMYATLEASTYYHHLFFPCLEMQAVWRKNGPIIVELSGTLCHYIAFMTDHDTSLFPFSFACRPTVVCTKVSVSNFGSTCQYLHFHVFLPSFCLPLIEKYLQSLLHNIRIHLSLYLVYHKSHLTIFG